MTLIRFPLSCGTAPDELSGDLACGEEKTMARMTYRMVLAGMALSLVLSVPAGISQAGDHSFSVSPDGKSKAKGKSKATCSGDCTTNSSTSVVVDPTKHNVTSDVVNIGTTTGGSTVISNSSAVVSHNGP